MTGKGKGHGEAGEGYAQHRPLLFSIAYRMTGSVADAEDIVQEAFARLAQAAELARRGGHALALRTLDHGLLRHPGSPELNHLRRSVLERMIEQNQMLNPFKFAYYAGLADLELPPAD
jgi:hypothetical protein